MDTMEKITDREVIAKLREIYNQLSETFNFKMNIYLDINISNRLRCMNGYFQYKRSRLLLNTLVEAKIVMSKALLEEFGWDRFEKTFRHEVAHVAHYVLYGKGNHTRNFKILCQKFGGSMNSAMAGVSFKECATSEFVKVKAKWEYRCTKCGVVIKRAKRMSYKKKNSYNCACITCKNPLIYWEEKQVG